MKSGYPVEGTPELRERFRSAWYHLDALAAPSFSEVVARYSEPHRAYHTLEHIIEGYRWLEDARHLAFHTFELELALIYHDIVYDSWRSDNERRSAELFREHAQAARVAVGSIDRICAGIEATATHSARLGDAALLGDIDLWVLGAPPERYAVYERQVVQEYGYVAVGLFRTGREKVLRGFLAKKSIYGTAFFRERLELRARRNLRRALAGLEQSQVG